MVKHVSAVLRCMPLYVDVKGMLLCRTRENRISNGCSTLMPPPATPLHRVLAERNAPDAAPAAEPNSFGLTPNQDGKKEQPPQFNSGLCTPLGMLR